MINKLSHQAILAAAALLVLLANHTIAQAQVEPVPLVGWTNYSDFEDAQVPGIIGLGTDANRSSGAVVAEINGDLSSKEVAVVSASGILQVYNADGSLHFQAKLPNADCTFTSSNNKSWSSPAVGELFGNGVPYVVVGYGGIAASACGGGVISFNGVTGEQAGLFDTTAYNRRKRSFMLSPTVYGTPALYDVDGDGRLEIAWGSHDRYIYLANPNLSIRWRLQAADTVWSSPAFADIDGDGKVEMVIGTDISQNLRINPPTHNGGYVYAIDPNYKGAGISNVRGKAHRKKRKKRKGSEVEYPFRNGNVKWYRKIKQTVFSAPSIGELIPESPGLEIVVGTGCYFPEGTNNKTGRYFKILSSAGKVLRKLNVTSCSSSSPAIGDVNGDGRNDVVVTVPGHDSIGGDGTSHVIAWEPRSNTVLWDAVPRFNSTNDEWLGHFSSAIIADLDGNGSHEVAVPNGRGVVILRGDTGESLTCSTGLGSCDPDSFVTSLKIILSGTLAVGDLDNDGLLDLVGAGKRSEEPRRLGVFALTGFADNLGSPVGPNTAYSAPWPMYRRSAARDGALID